MKLQETVTDLEVDGSFEATEMTIELSAHAYSVLSKGLYSDPYRAIVRELSCNAWDSHIVAGKTDVPFEVCLPNVMEPVFKVRDFGTGLPPDKIETLYTYFKSTKQASEHQTGFFGLGSKSPFSYTKKFTSVSFYEGKKYHFVVFLNAKGIPGTMLMSTEDTTEPNGIEVSFTVEQQDFQSFHHAARAALRPFQKKPTIRGVHITGSFFNTPANPFLEGKDWKLYSAAYGTSPVERATACMGNVEYPLGTTGRSGMSKNAQALLGSLLLVEFPLGAFEITPAREAIQWTEYSIANINEKLEAIYDEIVTHVTNKISAAPSLWQANIENQTLVESGPLSGLGLRPTWKGKSVKGVMQVPADVNLMRIAAESPSRSSSGAQCKNAASVSQQTVDVRPRVTKFYFADFAGSLGRVSNYVRDHFNRNESCYVIVPVDEVVEDDKRYTDYKAKNPTGYCPYLPQIPRRKPVYEKARLQAFLDAFGILEKDVVMASAVPQRPRQVTERQARLVGSKARAFSFDEKGYGVAADCYWREAEVDLAKTDESVYIELNKWQFVNSKLAVKPAAFKVWLGKFRKTGLDLPASGLIGVKTADMKKFQKATNWITLDEYATKKLRELWQSKDFQLCYKALTLFNEEAYFHKLATFAAADGVASDFKKIVTDIGKVIENSSKSYNFGVCVSHLTDAAWNSELTTIDSGTQDLVSQATKRYPLLHALFGDRCPTTKAVIQYAQLIDNERK